MQTSIQLLGEFLTLFLKTLSKKVTPKEKRYSAGFGKSSTVLRKRHQGFPISGPKALSRQDSFRNFLAIGGSGAGKSVNLFIPLLLDL